MYTQVSQSDFIDAFRTMDRMDNFSYDGLVALYDWFNYYEEETGESIELDVIAICCDFTEMSWDDVEDNYKPLDCVSIDELRGWLEDNTIVVYSDNDKVLFQLF